MAQEPLITLHPLAIHRGGQHVCDVGPWAICAGERWWVRGPNGSGKSSLLSLLAGDLWPSPGQHDRRIYHFDHDDTWSPLAAKGHVARLDPERQNRYLHQDWDLTAAEVVATGFLDTDILHERPDLSEMTRLAEVMHRLEIRSLWDRKFLELSQGERRRVLIARALAKDPDILLLDEFAEGLDRASRASLWRTLDDLAHTGKAIILTTHRPGPALDGWQTLDLPPSKPRDTTPSTPDNERPPRQEPVPETLVSLKGDFFLEGQPLIQDLDWQLQQGAHTAVLGPNGCGKTSFLRLLWGELHLAFGGQTTHFENPDLTVHALRRHIGYFQPDMHAWFRPNQDCADIILSGLFSTIDLFNSINDTHRRAMRSAAAAVEATPFLTRPFSTLSYGQARRVLLARALVSQPALALLDEPFDGLDQAVREKLFDQLQRIAETSQTTFVLTSHHAEDRPPWIRQHLSIAADRTLKSFVLEPRS